MAIATILAGFILLMVLSYLVTGVILKVVKRNKILDHPGSRSLHENPLPRGGGVTVAILVLSCLLVMQFTGVISALEFWAFFLGGVMTFIIGLLDDVRTVSVKIKGMGYLMAALCGVGIIESIQLGNILDEYISIVIWGMVITWAINLYNFMDGSDGLAGMQAVLAGSVMICVAYVLNLDLILYLSLVITASSCGFLIYNFPPAKLFMGDSGSCFLGFIFGMTGYYSTRMGLLPLAFWLVLFSVFICDSALTLMMRIVSGEKWYQAHRQHAYQKLILAGHSHRWVLIHFILLFIVLLLPMALLVLRFEKYAVYIVVLCYMLIITLWAIIQYQYKNRT